ncbi:MAG: hypothetical protein H7138_08320 [Myxococcales bacterium]|nr:hypothetical protein [Myxococcales bacterium]
MSAKPGRLAVISIPPLAARADEISRLVHEVAVDIMGERGAPSTGFTMHDLERLGAIKFSGIADMEDSIRRVIAMRTWGVTAGAKSGSAPSSPADPRPLREARVLGSRTMLHRHASIDLAFQATSHHAPNLDYARRISMLHRWIS